jgi:hypothetical protein
LLFGPALAEQEVGQRLFMIENPIIDLKDPAVRSPNWRSTTMAYTLAAATITKIAR